MKVKTIFAVDDDREHLEYLKTALSSKGRAIFTSSDGRRAISEISASCPDLVILDIDMPFASGLDLCRELKRHDATRGAAIIVWTAHTTKAHWLASLKFGADLFLPKTSTLDDLLSSVEALLDRVPPEKERGGIIHAGTFSIDPRQHIVALGDKTFDGLTTKPFDLAYLLARQRPHILSRREIMKALHMTAVRDNEINVLMHELRRHLAPMGRDVFKTAFGQGYYFNESAVSTPSATRC